MIRIPSWIIFKNRIIIIIAGDFYSLNGFVITSCKGEQMTHLRCFGLLLLCVCGELNTACVYIAMFTLVKI